MNKREAERMHRIKIIVDMILEKKRDESEVVIQIMATFFISKRLAQEYFKTAQQIVKNGRI